MQLQVNEVNGMNVVRELNKRMNEVGDFLVSFHSLIFLLSRAH